jgi:hypothetical protein
MEAFSWTSRHTYRDEKKGRVGRIVYSERLGRYLLKDASGRECMVHQDWAKGVRRTEERLNSSIGRPPMFPNETNSSKYITLPDRLWEKLGSPWSANLAALIERAYE